MPHTLLRQFSQIRNSDIYDDLLDVLDAETSAENIEEDFNYIRSQLKVITGVDNWYEPPKDNFNLSAIHDKKLTYWVKNGGLTHIPSGQNFVVLSGSSKPSDIISFQSGTVGAVVSTLPGTVGTHSLSVDGNRQNLLEVFDYSTGKTIQNELGLKIYALLQVGSDATNGSAFSDTGNNRGQLSFVYIEPSTDVITAVNIPSIENYNILYYYRNRTDFYNLPENAFNIPFANEPSSGFVSKRATRIIASPINANTPINISTFVNPDLMSFGSSGLSWVKNYDVYLNGILVLNGETSSINNDVYYIDASNIAFEYNLEINDIVQIIQREF